ncbi:putative CONSERVED MEMBRANE domain protein [Mycobacterium xenopi 3993]|nr:putative CONSERVED MEMBRANE domain protein [Mycobacterium xenopi 3993]
MVHRDHTGPHPHHRHHLGGARRASAFATSTTINHRQHALSTVLNHTEPLAFAAGRLYTTLSVADAAAATAFIAQAEPRTVRQRYEQAITDAAVAVTRASSGLTDEPLGSAVAASRRCCCLAGSTPNWPSTPG